MFSIIEHATRVGYSEFGFVWHSSEEDVPYNRFVLYFGQSVWHFKMPNILKPKMVGRAASPIQKISYNQYTRRSYGIHTFDRSIHIQYGIQPGCWSRLDRANSDHVWVLDYPWNLQHIEHRILFLDGTLYKIYDRGLDHDDDADPLQKYPKAFTPLEVLFVNEEFDKPIITVLNYVDTDGEVIPCRIHLEERLWRRGKNKIFRWLLQFLPGSTVVTRSINMTFANEVGSKKGSWKGGVIGTSHTMKPNETIQECFTRMHRERRF